MFTVVIGERQVRCGISRAALIEACDCNQMNDRDCLPEFLRSRLRIEAIAAAIFAERPEGVTGTLNIWADDVTHPPAAPAAAKSLAHLANG